jgi:hypothetical protein
VGCLGDLVLFFLSECLETMGPLGATLEDLLYVSFVFCDFAIGFVYAIASAARSVLVP